MPRASWRGFLRLSLVSCPIYLSPATTRTKPIRLHQVWQPAPADVGEDDLPDRGGGQQGSAPSVTRGTRRCNEEWLRTNLPMLADCNAPQAAMTAP